MILAADDVDPLMPRAAEVFMGFVSFMVIAGFVLVVVMVVRNRNALKRAGYDPMTAQVQMADRFIKSQEHPSLETRLKELDDLHSRGVISDEEHAKARADALAHP